MVVPYLPPSPRFSYAERAWAGPEPEQQVVAIDGDFRVGVLLLAPCYKGVVTITSCRKKEEN